MDDQNHFRTIALHFADILAASAEASLYRHATSTKEQERQLGICKSAYSLLKNEKAEGASVNRLEKILRTYCKESLDVL